MMKVLGRYSWQVIVLVVLLVILFANMAQSQPSHDAATTIQALQRQAQQLIALERWEAAIPVLDEALQLSRSDRQAEARILTLLGECYRGAEMLDRALTYYEQARAAYAAIGMGSSTDMAVVLFAVGRIYVSLGHFADAIEATQEAQKIFKDKGQGYEEAEVWQEQGQIFFSLGQYKDASQSFYKALELYQAYGGRIDTIAIYQDMGQVSVQMGKYEDALNSFHTALSIAQVINRTDAVARTYVQISGVYSALGRYADALNALSQAESLYKRQEAWLELANVQFRYAELQSELGAYEQGLNYYRKAADYLKMALSGLDRIAPVEGMRYSRPVTRLQILRNIEMCYEVQKEWDNAVQPAESAVQVIDSMPWLSSNETTGVYNRLISLLVRLGRGADALVYAERWRVRAIHQVLYTPSELQSADTGSATRIVPSVVDIDVISNAIIAAQQDLQPNEAVLEYFVTQDGIYLWVITKGGIGTPIFIKYSRDQLMHDVITLRKALESINPNQITLTEFLTSFYTKLVKPGLDELTGKKIDTLIFILSGPLWYLPFAAMEMSDHKESSGVGTRYPYLVEHYTIAYLPSLVSLPTLMATEADKGGSVVEFMNFPMAYPDFETLPSLVTQCLVGQGHRVYVYARYDATESRLKDESPGASLLLLLCRVRIDMRAPLQSELLLAEDDENDGHLHAWEVLQLDLKRIDLVILPTVETLPIILQPRSTLFNPPPWRTASYGTTPGRSANVQPVATQAGGVQFTPDLLQALNSGTSGMIWPLAFLSAGAKGVLQTSWLSSPSIFNKLLMTMGSYCRGGDTWAQALARAQRDLIKSSDFSNPWFWAPYQLIGRWR